MKENTLVVTQVPSLEVRWILLADYEQGGDAFEVMAQGGK